MPMSSSGVIALTVPYVPTGMKMGVSTTPRGNVRRPRRAPPSGAEQFKLHSHELHDRRVQEHRVTITEETIALRNGVPIGAHDCIEAAERADQHQQGRFGQMKVGQQRIDDAEPIARRDEQSRLAFERLQRAGCAADSRVRTTVVPTATTRPPRCLRCCDRCADLGTDADALGVHAMLSQIVDAHVLKRAGADMQRHERRLTPMLATAREHRGIEMQTRRRCGDRARFARVDGLIARRVVSSALRSMYGGNGIAPCCSKYCERLGAQLQFEQIVVTRDEASFNAAGQRDRRLGRSGLLA